MVTARWNGAVVAYTGLLIVAYLVYSIVKLLSYRPGANVRFPPKTDVGARRNIKRTFLRHPESAVEWGWTSPIPSRP